MIVMKNNQPVQFKNIFNTLRYNSHVFFFKIDVLTLKLTLWNGAKMDDVIG